jgi:uncharacterized protein YcbK (DUF882 family)
MKDGRRIPEAMRKINWILRDWRKDQAIEMDPDLVDLLWEIHEELGSAEPIHIISGYRSPATNEMLRKTVGGQASHSRHILGKAADVHFPDVPLSRLRYSALIHERGGVGYYPTSAIPFVHIDTDRVRAWPRLPRAELALLFPTARTQHLPADGGPLTRDDVRQARATHPELVAQIAAFNELRTKPKAMIQVASLTPPLPQLLTPPQLAQRPPSTSVVHPSDGERARLAALAADEPPKLLSPPHLAGGRARTAGIASTGELHMAAADPVGDLITKDRAKQDAPISGDTVFVPAPAYDEEHPEELSYRPFPIAPLLTETASADDPALTQMFHPDLGKILELIDQTGSAIQMRFRPGSQLAQLMWEQEFKGEAVNVKALFDSERSTRPNGLTDRKVLTQSE